MVLQTDHDVAEEFCGANYREVFVGAGATVLHSKRVILMEELYFDLALGRVANSARYLRP